MVEWNWGRKQKWWVLLLKVSGSKWQPSLISIKPLKCRGTSVSFICGGVLISRLILLEVRHDISISIQSSPSAVILQHTAVISITALSKKQLPVNLVAHIIMLTAQIIMCHTSASKPLDLGNKALIEHPHCPQLESSILKEVISKNKPNFPYMVANSEERKSEFKI